MSYPARAEGLVNSTSTRKSTSPNVGIHHSPNGLSGWHYSWFHRYSQTCLKGSSPSKGQLSCTIKNKSTGRGSLCSASQTKKYKLSVENACLLREYWVIIPHTFRQQQVLKELHQLHPSIAKMKTLARNYVWWPGMNAEFKVLFTQPLLSGRIWHNVNS